MSAERLEGVGGGGGLWGMRGREGGSRETRARAWTECLWDRQWWLGVELDAGCTRPSPDRLEGANTKILPRKSPPARCCRAVQLSRGRAAPSTGSHERVPPRS